MMDADNLTLPKIGNRVEDVGVPSADNSENVLRPDVAEKMCDNIADFDFHAHPLLRAGSARTNSLTAEIM